MLPDMCVCVCTHVDRERKRERIYKLNYLLEEYSIFLNKFYQKRTFKLVVGIIVNLKRLLREWC